MLNLGFGRTARAPERPAPQSPFRYGTRQRWASVGSQAFALAGRYSFELPRVGFASALVLRLSGTMTLGGAGVLTTRAPWDILRTIRVKMNVGAATIYSTTGYGNYVVQRLLGRNFDVVTGGGATPDADLYAAAVAMGANTWALTYFIPLGANFGKQFQDGVLNLQSGEVQVNVDGEFMSAGADIVSNFTSFAGTLTCGYLYYEVPDPRQVMWPPLMAHRIIEDQQNITAIGQQVYTSPREGILLRLAHIVQQNDARTNDVSGIKLRFNKTDEVYDYRREELKFWQSYHYGIPLPTGVFAFDFWAAETRAGEGDNRDQISAEALSTLESLITTTGAVGGSLNRLDSLREYTQFLSL